MSPEERLNFVNLKEDFLSNQFKLETDIYNIKEVNSAAFQQVDVVFKIRLQEQRENHAYYHFSAGVKMGKKWKHVDACYEVCFIRLAQFVCLCTNK